MGQASCTSVVSAWPAVERRRNLALWLARCDGNVLRTAHKLGIHRSHMYRLLYDYKLWPAVNQLRKRKLERDRDRKRGIHV